ncbi:maltose ABC transporter permease MalF [Rubrivivax gelatinosus]|uniref:Maltose/maltodextrin transport system permease protein n=1 Tax=Rubrivivax gelatinosus TaxID=28068 RepID=A0ABS1DS80_RUBGE|nr:maltose ABC transporter permease MalF [Rubrivivax gelatinosus]MBK1712040.1 maltose ABC transporter permease MalF [Rubrivivax gelatinosus]
MGRTDWGRLLKWPFTTVTALACLWLVFRIYASGQPLWALLALGLLGLGFFVYLSNVAFAYRYLFPGLAGMLVFVAFPLLYTVQIGFTNYSSANLLTLERATAYLLEQSTPGDGAGWHFTLHPDGSRWRLLLAADDAPDDETPEALAARSVVTPPLALAPGEASDEIALVPLAASGFTPGDPLPLGEVLKRRQALATLKLALPDGSKLSYAGVREFATLTPTFTREADGVLRQTATGTLFRANGDTGFYESEAGERLQPGFKVGIGFGNYLRMVEDPDFRGPFMRIFVWTVVFAGLTVLFTLAVGTTLAVLLNWEALRFRTVYRTLLFLPYAVPGFISILVFKGLFNQNFGEINLILNALFGIKPSWFADPFLAKVMILLVNTWLGYPYIMVLCTGLIKAIPADLYEASAISGAKPLTNFWKITAPLIVKPLTPLLIASFAFNFNNFVLIALLTNGRPDFLNTKVPAGTTDILVSYTYRIAFQDSGQNFGLAAAISTIIFFLVAMLSMANLKLAKVNDERK